MNQTKVTPKMELLQSHVKEEIAEDIPCTNCGQSFMEIAEIEKHKEICNNRNNTSYLCKTCCRDEFSLLELESHLENHGGFKFFKCIICQEIFSNLWELNTHLPIHLSEEKFTDRETDGNKNTTNQAIVKREEQDHITDQNVENDALNSPPMDSRISSDRDVVNMPMNEKKRIRKRGRPKRMTIKTVEEERKYHCPHCSHRSKTFSNMKKHIRTHSGQKPFECAMCGNHYSDKYALRDHLLMKHVRMKKLKEVCQHCGKAFKLRKGLLVHIRTQHMSKEKYSCFVCGKMYASKNSVDLHIRIHSNEPGRHSCPKCGKSFDRRDLMLQHHRHIHVAPKKFQCNWDSCAFQSVTQAAFVLHQRTHTGEKPFQCGICDKLFKSKMAVSLHTINMHKPASLQCGFCEKVFKLPCALRNHVRRIHQEKTLPCPFCDKKYGFKADLTRHVKNSHSNKKM